MNKNIKMLLERFPKKRLELSSENQAIYEKEYLSNRQGTSSLVTRVTRLLEGWMHRQVSQSTASGSVLEIGAGTLNHVPYESKFTTYDVVEPFTLLYEKTKHARPEIQNFYCLTEEIPLHIKYDRIISIAVFEHMTDLPKEIDLIKKHLNNNGKLQIGIPTEGGFLWGLAWRLTTGISYRLRTGLSYQELMRHEHVNEENEIVQLIEYFFDDVHIKRFPLPWKHLSFYTYICATNVEAK